MSKARVKPAAVKTSGTVTALAETPNAALPAGGDGAAPAADAPPQAVPNTVTYIVGDCPMLHDGDVYAPGDEIELTPEQARRSARRVSLPVSAFSTLNME